MTHYLSNIRLLLTALLICCSGLIFGQIPCCPPNACPVGGAQGGTLGSGGDEGYANPCFGLSLPFDHDFNAGLPGCWTIYDQGNTPDTWEAVNDVFGNTLDGSPFMYVTGVNATFTGFMNELLVGESFNGLNYSNVQLEFDQYLNLCCGSQPVVGILIDGGFFQPVQPYNMSMGNWGAPNHQVIDLTPFLSPEMQVAFGFDGPGGFPEHWAVDNVNVSGVPIPGAGGCGPNCGPDSYEPNNSPTDAYPFNIPANYTYPKSRICPMFDVDWYSFKNSSPKNTLQIKLDKLPADLDVELYDPACRPMAISNNTGLTDEAIKVGNLPTGKYFVKVTGKAAAWSENPYALSINLIPPAATVFTLKPDKKSPFPLPLRETVPADALFIYPNPADDVLNLVFTMETAGMAELSIMDLSGKTLIRRSENLEAGKRHVKVATGNLSPGTYLLRLTTDKMSRTKKFVITAR